MTIDPDRLDPNIDYVIEIPTPWRKASQARDLKYFIPDWDDLVDPDYDFENEQYARSARKDGTPHGGWFTEVYAHQLYEQEGPSYDGILVSRAVIEKSKKKHTLLENLKEKGGIHRYLRVPPEYPVMGDCGAFGYAKEEKPPYTTADVLDYYTDFGFDYGVSTDHLVSAAMTPEAKQERYRLTQDNAADFLREHRARGLSWTPIGAVQGWDPASYKKATSNVIAMGYRYVALGGLVMSKTPQILSIFEAVHEVVPSGVKVHAFGLARLGATQRLVDLGVTSIDSASPLRKAWLDADKNYWTLDGIQYAALRVPHPPRGLDGTSLERAEMLEQAALRTVRSYDRGKASTTDVLDALDAYHTLARPDERSMRGHYQITLEAQPWKQCPCAICQSVGVEVIIFRGNNRNRRRGFHNTYVFYTLLGQALLGETVKLIRAIDRRQLPLFP